MTFTDVDGTVSLFTQESRQGDGVWTQAFPVPVGWSLFSSVIGCGIDPVGGPMSGRVLTCHQRDACR